MNISYIMSKSKTLTDLDAIKQKIKIENTFASSVCNVLVVKKKREEKSGMNLFQNKWKRICKIKTWSN